MGRATEGIADRGRVPKIWIALTEEEGEGGWEGAAVTNATWGWAEPAGTKATWGWGNQLRRKRLGS